MRFYFVRHGQSEANVLRVISNRNLPHGLTEVGRQQVAALAEQLKDVPLTAIYSSPIVRAVETAQGVANARNQSFEMVDALREPDCGIMEGRGDEAAWAAHQQVVDDWLCGKFDSRIAGGECYNDLRARFIPFIKELLVTHRNTDHNLLLITHGSLLYMMLPLILANIDFASVGNYSMPNTGIILAEPRDNELVCLEWCGERIVV